MTSLPSLHIAFNIPAGRSYKSLTRIEWRDVTPFSVLTGRNGTGKTQLLEFLARRLTDSNFPVSDQFRDVPVRITGAEFSADEIVFIPSNQQLHHPPTASFSELRDLKNNLYSQYIQNNNPDFHHRVRRAKLMKAVQRPGGSISQADFLRLLPDDLTFLIEESNVTSSLSHLFVDYRARALRDREAGRSEAEIRQKRGLPPWETLNEVMKAADFPYTVNNPLGTDIFESFSLHLTGVAGEQISANDLSSGEAMILQVVLWLYYSQHHGRFPKLMLLDEPDAHLHPSMTRQFMTVMNDILVGKYGVRVIMSTHSPSTVALAPDGSVFEMEKGRPTVDRSPSRDHTIGLLTAGLVTVGPGTKYIFVEDHADVEFYSVVRDLLADNGPTRDPMSLQPAPSMVFLPASIGTGKSKTGGGCTVVRSTVYKFRGTPLQSVFRGIVDRDSDNTASDSVDVISRYSIENYIFDPITVACALLEEGDQTYSFGRLRLGDEHLLRIFPEAHLQELLNIVCTKVQKGVATLESSGLTVDVRFTNGVTLRYPKWALDIQGHQLPSMYRSAYPKSRVITPPKLLQALRRVRLVPRDLADMLRRLQA